MINNMEDKIKQKVKEIQDSLNGKYEVTYKLIAGKDEKLDTVQFIIEIPRKDIYEN